MMGKKTSSYSSESRCVGEKRCCVKVITRPGAVRRSFYSRLDRVLPLQRYALDIFRLRCGEGGSFRSEQEWYRGSLQLSSLI